MGYGPEVIDINTRTPGEYLYYVDKFADEGDLAASGATVTRGFGPRTGLQPTYTVPSTGRDVLGCLQDDGVRTRER